MEVVKSSIWGNIVMEAVKGSMYGTIVMEAVMSSIWGNIWGNIVMAFYLSIVMEAVIRELCQAFDLRR